MTIFMPRFSPILRRFTRGSKVWCSGGISTVFEKRYPGIAIQAVGLTFGVLAVMLGIYGTRHHPRDREIQDRRRRRHGREFAWFTWSTIVASFFGVQIPFIHQPDRWGSAFRWSSWALRPSTSFWTSTSSSKACSGRLPNTWNGTAGSA